MISKIRKGEIPILNRKQKKLLKYIKTHPGYTVPEQDQENYEIVQHLLELSFLDQKVLRKGKQEVEFQYQISQAGLAYLDRGRREFVLHWLPYIFTTFISIAALVNSILARMGL